MSTFILAAARRASPIISKFGPFRRHFNPIVAAATAIPRFFSSSERVGVAADERMKRVLEAKIRHREVVFRYLLVVFVVGLEWLKNMACVLNFDELLS